MANLPTDCPLCVVVGPSNNINPADDRDTVAPFEEIAVNRVNSRPGMEPVIVWDGVPLNIDDKEFPELVVELPVNVETIELV